MPDLTKMAERLVRKLDGVLAICSGFSPTSRKAELAP